MNEGFPSVAGVANLNIPSRQNMSDSNMSLVGERRGQREERELASSLDQ